MARHASPLQSLLVDDAFEGEIYPQEPLAKHTSYRLGGPAKFFVEVFSLGALRHVIDCCDIEGLPWIVIGRGSNLLVADEGFPGVVITLGRDFKNAVYHEDEHILSAGAGVLLSNMVTEAFRRSLGGLEFAVDIPGTIGGALTMNAGSRNEGMGDVVSSATVLTHDGALVRLPASELTWGYRQGAFDPADVLVECELALKPADPFYIRGKMEAAHARRKKTQPFSRASCGSVFRNPEGDSAGRLIEAAGLKGFTLGGAQVSEKHANFIINDGSATAQDVFDLIHAVQEKVFEVHGTKLEPEVRFVGFSQDN